MTLASIFSIQSLTVTQDIFWSLVLIITTVLRFGVAEHRPIFILSVDRIVRMAKIWSIVIDSVIIASVLTTFTLWNIVLSFAFCFGCSLLPRGQYSIGITLLRWPDSLSTLILLRIVSKYYMQHQMIKIVGTSVADLRMKKLTFARASFILIEGAILWQLRCYHRFPHVYRYRAVFLCFINLIIAICWCHKYLSDTKVSYRATIQTNGHGVTPSLNAIRTCPICKKSVTSLDIEDAFD
jgi:hypothetical protein